MPWSRSGQARPQLLSFLGSWGSLHLLFPSSECDAGHQAPVAHLLLAAPECLAPL